jgi:hypothetical protein
MTAPRDDLTPDFLRMPGTRTILPPSDGRGTDIWYGWDSVHVIRGRAWNGAGAIANVEVSVDGGASWQTTHIEPPRERWMWVRWSYVWEAHQPGHYRVMSRATDEVGRVEPQTPRYNNMRKNFSAIVPTEVTIR